MCPLFTGSASIGIRIMLWRQNYSNNIGPSLFRLLICHGLQSIMARLTQFISRFFFRFIGWKFRIPQIILQIGKTHKYENRVGHCPPPSPKEIHSLIWTMSIWIQVFPLNCLKLPQLCADLSSEGSVWHQYQSPSSIFASALVSKDSTKALTSMLASFRVHNASTDKNFPKKQKQKGPP